MNNKISTIDNQKGSLIIYTILILAILSIIGISSINSTITESFIVRNMAVQKQNIQVVDTAVLEALQVIIDMDVLDPVTGLSPDGFTPDDLLPSTTTVNWIHSKELWSVNDGLWYGGTVVGQIMDATNSAIPNAVTSGALDIINGRREAAAGRLRYAFVGWDAAPGYSLKATQPTRRTGRILGEYVSDRYGVTRIQIGVEKKI